MNESISQNIETEPKVEQCYLTDKEAAEYVGGITSRTVRVWRVKAGLPYIQINRKIVRVRKSDLDKWILKRRVTHSVG